MCTIIYKICIRLFGWISPWASHSPSPLPQGWQKKGEVRGKGGMDGWGQPKRGRGATVIPTWDGGKKKKVRAGFGCWPGVRERDAGQIFDHGSRRESPLPFSQTNISSPPPFYLLHSSIDLPLSLPAQELEKKKKLP